MEGLLVVIPTETEYAGLESALPRGIDLLIPGIGPVNMAIRLMRWLMENPRPRLMMLLGTCGSYLKGDNTPFFQAREVVLAQSQSYGDLGRCRRSTIEEIKLEDGPISKKMEAYPISELPFIANRISNSHPKIAPMTTLMCSSASFDRASLVRSRTGAMCEGMEGAPFFEIAHEFQIPFVEIRAVSNIAGASRESWDLDGALYSLKSFLKGLFK